MSDAHDGYTGGDGHAHDGGDGFLGDDPTTTDPTSSGETPVETHGEGDRMDWIEEPQDAGSEHCGPTSIAELLTWFSGDHTHPYTESQVVADAEQAGLLTDTGMSIPGVAELLTAEGIPAHLEDASAAAQTGENPLLALDQYLDDGRGVILAIDSKEIWYGEQDVPGQPDQDPDHALIVSQIAFDASDPHGGYAILQDSGLPGDQGVGERVPLDTLLNAWSDSNYSMIVTDQAPSWFSDEQQAISDVPQQDQPVPASDPSLVPDQPAQPVDYTPAPAEPATTPSTPALPTQDPTQTPVQLPVSTFEQQADGGSLIQHALEESSVWAGRGALMVLPVGVAGKALLDRRRRA